MFESMTRRNSGAGRAPARLAAPLRTGAPARTGALAAAAAAILALALPAAAGAEVRLGREAIGDYRVKVMSWWEIPFRTVVRQRYDFSCGSAAVATLLTHHYGRRTGESQPFAEMWRAGDQAVIRENGFSMFDMKRYLDGLGYRAEGFRVTTEQLAQGGRPGIVLIDLNGFKHFVVVKGIRGNRILLGDPMLGLTEYSLADFQRMWNGIFLVILESGETEPSFNLAGDWGPWSRAPMEANGALRLAVGDVTTHLPPEYQLVPQMLIDVRTGIVQ